MRALLTRKLGWRSSVPSEQNINWVCLLRTCRLQPYARQSAYRFPILLSTRRLFLGYTLTKQCVLKTPHRDHPSFVHLVPLPLHHCSPFTRYRTHLGLIFLSSPFSSRMPLHSPPMHPMRRTFLRSDSSLLFTTVYCPKHLKGVIMLLQYCCDQSHLSF